MDGNAKRLASSRVMPRRQNDSDTRAGMVRKDNGHGAQLTCETDKKQKDTDGRGDPKETKQRCQLYKLGILVH